MDIITLIMVALAFVIFLMLCGYMLCYVLLKPVMPYLMAKLKKEDLMLLIGRDNKLKMIPAKYSSGVFDSQKPPFSFIQRTPKTYRLGDRNIVIVIDDWGVVLDPDMAEALDVLHERGYTNYKQLESALKQVDEDGNPLIENSTIIKINAFRDFTVGEILNYTGDVKPIEIRAQRDEDVIDYLSNYSNLIQTKKGGNTSMIMIIMVVVLIAAGGFLMMSGGGGMPSFF